MRIISLQKLRSDAQKFPSLISVISEFSTVVKGGNWKNLVDLQKTYPSAESVGNFTVINIKGNKYRLILLIDYKHQIIYYKYLLTHAEYDKGKWKNDESFRKN